jgi:hypothetical protein
MARARGNHRTQTQLLRLLREPTGINMAQLLAYIMAGAAGLLAAVGGAPTFVQGTIGPVLSVAVGSVLALGGIIGAVAIIFGHWWLERIALLITGLGWVLLLPAALFFAFSGRSTSGIWLVVALVIVALSDCFKRYKRIDWAYLDPTK